MTFIRTVLAALLLAGLTFAGLAFAQQTPAGTQIQNQATAEYVDSAGQTQRTNSNQVTTIVQQVYDVVITPDSTDDPGDATFVPGQTQDATPGSVVYFPYTLTNEGNGADSFTLTSDVATDDTGAIADTTPVFYLDSDGNGVADSGELTEITSVDNLGAGASVKLIMAYQIPDNASADDTVIATPIGTSQGDATQVDDDNYHQTNVVQDAVISATKSVNRTTATTTSPNNELTYTITVRNTGSADATNVEVSDTLPAGVTYDSATTSPDVTVTTDGDPTTVTATFGTLTQGQEVELVINATVDADTVPGDLENSATVDYDDSNNVDRPDVTTNTTTTTVQADIGVVVGPNGQPDDAAAVDYDTSEDYNVTSTVGDDEQIVTSANSGSTVSFINTVRNDGTDTDTFNLTTDLDDLNLPDGASVQLFTLSGAPLSDSNNDGTPDTGPLDSDESRSFIVRVLIPANTPTDTDNADGVANPEEHSATITATSVADGSADTTTNTVQDIAGPGVSFGNNTDAVDNVGGVDNPNGVNEPANPGDIVVFPMDIVNNGSSNDTFNLSGSAAFTNGAVDVVYYTTNPDANGDGTVTPEELAALTPTSSTDPIGPGEEVTVYAVVTVPADATPQADAAVSQNVSSPTSGESADFNLNTITVNALDAFTFRPNRTGNLTSPGTVTYIHTLTNESNEDITGFTLSDDPSGLGTEGFTYTYSLDGVTFYPITDTANLSATIAPGATQDLYVRVSAPSGVVRGAVNTLDVTATATFTSGGTAAQTVTDTTTVVGGELSLVKTVDVDEAEPGDTLTYTVTATNLGTDDLTEVIVSDPLPAFTDFVSVSATLNGYPANGDEQVLYSVDGTTYVTDPTGLTLAAGESIYVGVDSDGDGDVDEDDALVPGANVVLTFVVEIQ